MSDPVNYAGVSDDDFEQMLESGEGPSPEEPSEAPEEEFVDEEGSESYTAQEDEEATEEAVEETSEVAEESNDEEATDEETETGDDVVEETDTDQAEAQDFEAQVNDLFKPFKANGKDMQIKSIEEARTLMMKGAGFEKGMASIKPHRGTIKTLENNAIDSDRLNLLIDASKGDTGAISKLVHEHGINIRDLESEGDSSYSPSNHQVSGSVVELDDVIAEIGDTATFDRTAKIVSDQWDDASKQAVLNDPTILRDLNAHVANGTFDRVMQEVNRQQVFGQLKGLSELQAYQQVVNQYAVQQQQAAARPNTKLSTKPTKKAKSNSGKKLRASPNKGQPAQTTTDPSSYAGMSDADFEKLIEGENS